MRFARSAMTFSLWPAAVLGYALWYHFWTIRPHARRR